MTDIPRLSAALAFAAVAVFLVICAWPPARDELRREEVKVTDTIAQSNAWYEVQIIISTGSRIACRSRRGWPLLGPNRCPLEEFEQLMGRSATVMHDGKRPYEVTAGDEVVVGYSAHRTTQLIAVVLAGLMLAMSALVWKRK